MKDEHKRFSTKPKKELKEELELALEETEDVHEAKQALKEIEEHGAISFEEMKRRVG